MVFGEGFIAAKSASRSRRPASTPPKRNTVKSSAPADPSAAGPTDDAQGYGLVHSALRRMGWREREVRTALSRLERNETARAFGLPRAMDSAALLRAALAFLPAAGGR
jgi:hypothetical protein